jgi:hypothetical protein
MARTLIALMQRSSRDWPDADGDEGGADRRTEAVSVGSDIRESYVRQLVMYVRCDTESYSSLEASSYAGALQGEPVRCFAHFARHQIVPSQLPLESHFCMR